MCFSNKILSKNIVFDNDANELKGTYMQGNDDNFS